MHDLTTKEGRAEVRKMCDAATPGHWLYDRGLVPPDGPARYSDIYTDDETIIAQVNDLIPAGLHNAALIRDSRTIIPAALDLLDAQDAEIAALKAERDRLREALSGMRNLLKPVRAITAHEVGALVGIIDGALSPEQEPAKAKREPSPAERELRDQMIADANGEIEG